MTIKATEVTGNWNFAADFPALPSGLIDRPHLLRTMLEALSSDAPILFIEGEEGDGATTTLAQICQAYPDQTFSLFIKPASSITYGLDYLRLALAEQFHGHFYGTSINKDLLTISEFEDLRLKVLRKNRSSELVFIIDGLHQIPAEGQAVLTQVFQELLPMGAANCRFLVTGLQSQIGKYIHNSVKSKPYRLLKLSFEECLSFLNDTGIDEPDCRKIYEVCKGGSPGRLAAVRRLLLAGTSLSDILDIDPAKYLEFIKLEFEAVDVLDELELLIVSGLTYSTISQTMSDVCMVFKTEPATIEKLLGKCQFLKISPSTQIEFISETHRKYAAKKLERFERAALEAQLVYLQNNPSSETSLRFLPAYLERLNHQDAILQLLSKEHYDELLKTTESVSALRMQAEVGARSAQELKRTHEVFKFSLQCSIFSSISNAGGSSERIKALVALGKSNSAMALAHAEATKEGRLVLLSTFARRLIERNGKPDSEILENIKRLIAEIDFSRMGDQAMKIAADVLIFDPDAAIGIIESAVQGATGAVKDAAYAELSFSASFAKLNHKTDIEDKARARISDQALQQIVASFGAMAEKLEFGELKVLLSKMPATRQVHLLRSFVSIKHNDPRILDFVELGLDIIVRETEYTPRVKDLADLCAPFFDSINDKTRLKNLVIRLDSQLQLVRKSSQSRELTLLQMRLAAAEYQYDKLLARERVTQSYYEVIEIRTPEVKMECLAIMLGLLTKLDDDGYLEKLDGFRALIKSDLEHLLDDVLNNTADHVSTVMPVLKALATDDCFGALLLASRLNTLPRRDIGYQTVAAMLVTRPFNAERLASVEFALGEITNDDLRSRATHELLSYIDANLDKSNWAIQLDKLRANLTNANELSHWDCWMFNAIVADNTGYSVGQLQQRITESLAIVDSPLEESRVYFRAAEALAEQSPAIAQQYYDDGSRIASSSQFGSNGASKLYELCLSLVGRSMTPLARANMLEEDKLVRHTALVDYLPGIIDRIRIFNEFAERTWCADREDLTKRTVEKNILPLLEQAKKLSPATLRAGVRVSFPSLCAYHLGLAIPWLDVLSDSEADDAVLDAALMKMRKISGQEPDGNDKFDYSKLNAAEIADVIELIPHARSDSAVFGMIRELVKSVNDRGNKNRFTFAQKADWSARLRPIIDEKLPDKKNIQHSGYKIVCLAQISALVEVNWSIWSDLEKQAEKIENCADRGYIYTEIAVTLPSKHAAHRKRLLEKALQDINDIPSPIDRLHHLHGYAKDAHSNDAIPLARDCLKAAMKLSMDIEEQSRIVEHRRDLIDLADQIDPGFADDLIQLLDDDPARGRLRSDAKRAGALAKAKREMADARHIKDAIRCNTELLPMAAWRNLGALIAGRLEVKPTDVMTHYVTLSGGGSLHEAYPVLSWHLANMDRKYTSQRDIRTHITPLCEAMLLTTELTYAILRKVSGTAVEVREEEAEDGLLVRRLERSKAVIYIEEWLRKNAKEQIIYCDPYFSTRDIDLLRVFLAQAPQCKVSIIASKPHLLKLNEMSEGPFLNAWRQQMDQSPPDTEIIAPGFLDAPDRHVLHDRWILTEAAGLRLGTSFNSLGAERLSEVSEMDNSRFSVVRTQIEKYLFRQRFVDNSRLQYSSFTL